MSLHTDFKGRLVCAKFQNGCFRPHQNAGPATGSKDSDDRSFFLDHVRTYGRATKIFLQTSQRQATPLVLFFQPRS